jgi:predicted SnoaL-like aldol condensation-catalyzing enzyme
MGRTQQEQNKLLVLEAFDTLFSKRDYAAAERFWSPDYIEHSAHIAAGRRVCSTSSGVFRRRSSTNRERS